MKKKTKKSCNQCGEQIIEAQILNFYPKILNVGTCTNPACPSYAILQVPVEDMPE